MADVSVNDRSCVCKGIRTCLVCDTAGRRASDVDEYGKVKSTKKQLPSLLASIVVGLAWFVVESLFFHPV